MALKPGFRQKELFLSSSEKELKSLYMLFGISLLIALVQWAGTVLH